MPDVLTQAQAEVRSTSTSTPTSMPGGDGQLESSAYSKQKSSDSEMGSNVPTSDTDPEKKRKNSRLVKQLMPYMSLKMTEKGRTPYHLPSDAAPGYIPRFSIQEGVSEGLEPLVGLHSIGVVQELEAFEIFRKWETNNHYNVTNSWGQRIYYACEKTNFLSRQFWGQNRPFHLNIIDGLGDSVMAIERRCNFCLCCCGGKVMGSNVIVKFTKSGQVLGKVYQNWSYCTPSFNIYDCDNELALKIVGPCCASCCRWCFKCDTSFKIYFAGQGFEDGEAKGTGAGEIRKKFGQEAVPINAKAPDATNYEVTFPADLHPSLKAVLMAAVFCIDFSYFESKGRTCSCSGLEMLTIFLIVVFIGVVITLIVLHIQGKL